MKVFDDVKPWYKANLHTHTTRSDGKLTPEECEATYRAAGYQVLAITDHRTSYIGKEEPDFILLPGAELDTCNTEKRYPEVYHIVGIGLPEWHDYHKMPSDVPVQDVIDLIHEEGGEAILAHPAWSMDRPDRMVTLKGLIGAEVYNTVSGIPFNSNRESSESLLDVTALMGNPLPMMAADDAHFYAGDECQSYVMIQPDTFTASGVMDALRNGKFYASRGPEIKQVEITDTQIKVTCSPCVTCVFLSQLPWVRGRAKMTPDGAEEYVYDIQKNEPWVRFELIDADGKKAWSGYFPTGR